MVDATEAVMKTLATWVDPQGEELRTIFFEKDLVVDWKLTEGGTVDVGDPTTPDGKTLQVPHRVLSVVRGEYDEEECNIVRLQKMAN